MFACMLNIFFVCLFKKPTCLNNQLVYVDCQKGTKVQVDSSQRMLRIADPDSRYSGYYSMQKHNNLEADNFYQTAWARKTHNLRRKRLGSATKSKEHIVKKLELKSY